MAWALVGGHGTPATAQAEQLSAGILGTASGKEADAALQRLWQFRDQLVAALGSGVYDRVALPSVGTAPIFADARELKQDVQQLAQALGLFFGESAERAGSQWARAFARPVWRALQGLRSHAASRRQDRTAPWVPAVKGIGGTLAQAVLSGRQSQAEHEFDPATTACVAGMAAELTMAAALRQAGLHPRVLEPGLQLPWRDLSSMVGLPRGCEGLIDLVLAAPLAPDRVPVLVEAKMLNAGKLMRDAAGTIARAAGQFESTLGRLARAIYEPTLDPAAARARSALAPHFGGTRPSFAAGRPLASGLMILGLPPGWTLPEVNPHGVVEELLQGRVHSAVVFAVIPKDANNPCRLHLARPDAAPVPSPRYVPLTPEALDGVLRASRLRRADRASERRAGAGPVAAARASARPTARAHF